jgi:hypothetical protein
MSAAGILVAAGGAEEISPVASSSTTDLDPEAEAEAEIEAEAEAESEAEAVAVAADESLFGMPTVEL